MDGGPLKNQRRFSGQTLVEFTLLLPIFLLLIIGFLDVGRAVFYYSSLSNATREGARYAIVTQGVTDDEIKNKVIEYAFGFDETSNPLARENIIIQRLPSAAEIKTNLSIQATYNFQSIFFPAINFDLVAQSNMRIPTHAR